MEHADLDVLGAALRFDWNAYCERVQLGPVSLDEGGLRTLHQAQFFNIPFENLDIHLGKGISTTPERIFKKCIEDNRGGYCFELNGLMLMALKHLGFEARPLLARVHLSDPPSGKTHQLNLVDLKEGAWLMDVGFGAGGPRCPLKLQDGFEARGEFWGFRIVQKQPYGWMLLSLEGGTWKESYSFDLGWVTSEDIHVANYFTSHSPDTHFTRTRVASLPTYNGRISLRDQIVTEMFEGKNHIWDLPPGAKTMAFLVDRFGIDTGKHFEDFQAPCVTKDSPQ